MRERKRVAFISLAFEPDVNLAVDELVALQHLAQSAPTMLRLVVGESLAKREVVEIVGLLRIVVRPNLVHPVEDGT